MRPTVDILGSDVKLFGVCVVVAVAASLALLGRYALERGVPQRWALEGVVVATAAGLVGARLYNVLDVGTGDTLTSGGLTWYGGVAGGTLGVLGYLAVRRIPLTLATDAAALVLPLAQAIGRIGCQLAGDGDYGTPSSLPWAMGYPHGTHPTPPGVEVHPTPIYETLALGLIALWLWRSRRALQGRLLAWYLLLAGIERFLVEFLRRNPDAVAGLTTAQLTSVALVVCGLTWIAVGGRTGVRQRTPV